MKTLKLHISVNGTDISTGCPSLPRFCPIALALRRALAERIGIAIASQCQLSVGGTRALVFYDGGWLRAPLPSEAQEFVGSFDFGGPATVKPITFDLEFTHLKG